MWVFNFTIENNNKKYPFTNLFTGFCQSCKKAYHARKVSKDILSACTKERPHDVQINKIFSNFIGELQSVFFHYRYEVVSSLRKGIHVKTFTLL